MTQYQMPAREYVPAAFRAYCAYSTAAVDQAKGLQHAIIQWHRYPGWYEQMSAQAHKVIENAVRALHPEANAAAEVARAVLEGRYQDAARIEVR